jgi:hypothetical protein
MKIIKSPDGNVKMQRINDLRLHTFNHKTVLLYWSAVYRPSFDVHNLRRIVVGSAKTCLFRQVVARIRVLASPAGFRQSLLRMHALALSFSRVQDFG